MRRVWNIQVDGQDHRVDVSWDVQLSGGGRIVVDGTAVDSWTLGVKFPGVSRRFKVGRLRAEIRQRWWDFDLYLNGRRVPDHRLVEVGGAQQGAGPYRAVAVALWLGSIAVLVFVGWLVFALSRAP
jgi:hypothetical protein